MHYHLFITSLPALPADFQRPGQPLTRIRLKHRLTMLPETEQRCAQNFLAFLDGGFDNARIVSICRQLEQELRGPARELFLDCCDIRMLSAAVRSLLLEQAPPPAIGRFRDHAVRFHHRPDLGLGHRFPWIMEIHHLLASEQTLAAQRRIDTIAWNLADRRAISHLFDFTGVLAYLLRWHIAATWGQRSTDMGVRLFEKTIEDILHAAA